MNKPKYNIRVIDGDTVEVNGRSVRLSGADTPEIFARTSGPLGGLAHAYTERNIESVDQTKGSDAYGRSLGDYKAEGGVDLGLKLVRQGLAIPTMDSASDPDYVRAFRDNRRLGPEQENDPYNQAIVDEARNQGFIDIDRLGPHRDFGGDPRTALHGRSGTTRRAWERGKLNLAANMQGFMQAANGLMGNEEESLANQERMARLMEDAGAIRKDVQSFRDISNPAEALNYAYELIVEESPSLLLDGVMSATGAGVGAAIGRRAAVRALTSRLGAEATAEQLARRGVNQSLANTMVRRASTDGMGTGAKAAFMASTYPQVTGMVQAELNENDLADKNLTALGFGALGTVVAAAPEMIMAGRIARQAGVDSSDLASVGSAARTALSNIGSMAALEGASEGAQDMIARGAVKTFDSDYDLFNEETFWESVVAGAVMGGTIATAGTVAGAGFKALNERSIEEANNTDEFQSDAELEDYRQTVKQSQQEPREAGQGNAESIFNAESEKAPAESGISEFEAAFGQEDAPPVDVDENGEIIDTSVPSNETPFSLDLNLDGEEVDNYSRSPTTSRGEVEFEDTEQTPVEPVQVTPKTSAEPVLDLALDIEQEPTVDASQEPVNEISEQPEFSLAIDTDQVPPSQDDTSTLQVDYDPLDDVLDPQHPLERLKEKLGAKTDDDALRKVAAALKSGEVTADEVYAAAGERADKISTTPVFSAATSNQGQSSAGMFADTGGEGFAASLYDLLHELTGDDTYLRPPQYHDSEFNSKTQTAYTTALKLLSKQDTEESKKKADDIRGAHTSARMGAPVPERVQQVGGEIVDKIGDLAQKGKLSDNEQVNLSHAARALEQLSTLLGSPRKIDFDDPSDVRQAAETLIDDALVKMGDDPRISALVQKTASSLFISTSGMFGKDKSGNLNSGKLEVETRSESPIRALRNALNQRTVNTRKESAGIEIDNSDSYKKPMKRTAKGKVEPLQKGKTAVKKVKTMAKAIANDDFLSAVSTLVTSRLDPEQLGQSLRVIYANEDSQGDASITDGVSAVSDIAGPSLSFDSADALSSLAPTKVTTQMAQSFSANQIQALSDFLKALGQKMPADPLSANTQEVVMMLEKAQVEVIRIAQEGAFDTNSEQPVNASDAGYFSAVSDRMLKAFGLRYGLGNENVDGSMSSLREAVQRLVTGDNAEASRVAKYYAQAQSTNPKQSADLNTFVRAARSARRYFLDNLVSGSALNENDVRRLIAKRDFDGLAKLLVDNNLIPDGKNEVSQLVNAMGGMAVEGLQVSRLLSDKETDSTVPVVVRTLGSDSQRAKNRNVDLTQLTDHLHDAVSTVDSNYDVDIISGTDATDPNPRDSTPKKVLGERSRMRRIQEAIIDGLAQINGVRDLATATAYDLVADNIPNNVVVFREKVGGKEVTYTWGDVNEAIAVQQNMENEITRELALERTYALYNDKTNALNNMVDIFEKLWGAFSKRDTDQLFGSKNAQSESRRRFIFSIAKSLAADANARNGTRVDASNFIGEARSKADLYLHAMVRTIFGQGFSHVDTLSKKQKQVKNARRQLAKILGKDEGLMGDYQLFDVNPFDIIDQDWYNSIEAKRQKLDKKDSVPWLSDRVLSALLSVEDADGNPIFTAHEARQFAQSARQVRQIRSRLRMQVDMLHRNNRIDGTTYDAINSRLGEIVTDDGAFDTDDFSDQRIGDDERQTVQDENRVRATNPDLLKTEKNPSASTVYAVVTNALQQSGLDPKKIKIKYFDNDGANSSRVEVTGKDTAIIHVPRPKAWGEDNGASMTSMLVELQHEIGHLLTVKAVAEKDSRIVKAYDEFKAANPAVDTNIYTVYEFAADQAGAVLRNESVLGQKTAKTDLNAPFSKLVSALGKLFNEFSNIINSLFSNERHRIKASTEFSEEMRQMVMEAISGQKDFSNKVGVTMFFGGEKGVAAARLAKKIRDFTFNNPVTNFWKSTSFRLSQLDKRLSRMLFVPPGAAQAGKTRGFTNESELQRRKLFALAQKLFDKPGVFDKAYNEYVKTGVASPRLKVLFTRLAKYENDFRGNQDRDGSIPFLFDDYALHRESVAVRGVLEEFIRREKNKKKQMELMQQLDQFLTGKLNRQLDYRDIMPGNPWPKQGLLQALIRGNPELGQRLTQLGVMRDSPTAMLHQFIGSLTARVEFERVFGGEEGIKTYDGKFSDSWRPNKKLTELLEGMAPENRDEAVRLVSSMMGFDANRISPAWRTFNEYAVAITSVLVLPFAGLASLPDVAGPVLRTHSFLDASTALIRVARMYRKNPKAMKEWVRATGVASQGIRDSALGSLWQAGSIHSRIPAAISGAVFKLNGLDAITKASRTLAAVLALDMVVQYAGQNNKETNRKLDKLGINREQALSLKKYYDDNGTFPVEDPRASAEHNKLADLGNRVASLYTDESVIHPNRSQKTAFMNDPRFQLFNLLKPFFYGFGSVMYGGLYRESRARFASADTFGAKVLASPVAASPFLLAALLLVPLAGLGLEIREWLRGKDSPIDSMSGAELTKRWFGRAGGLAMFELVDNAYMANDYGRSPLVSLAGPTAGIIDQAVRDVLPNQKGESRLPRLGMLDTSDPIPYWMKAVFD